MNSMKSSTQTCELLSALADGELGREEISVVLQSCRQDEAVVANWNAYHLIGDVLRSPAPAKRGADMAFLDRLNQRIAQEKTQARPAAAAAPTVGKLAPGLIRHRAPAANDGSSAGSWLRVLPRWQRWPPLPGMPQASWVLPLRRNWLRGRRRNSRWSWLRRRGPMVRDARLEELLAAHRELGSTSALQVPSGFLRNATFETPQNTGR